MGGRCMACADVYVCPTTCCHIKTPMLMLSMRNIGGEDDNIACQCAGQLELVLLTSVSTIRTTLCSTHTICGYTPGYDLSLSLVFVFLLDCISVGCLPHISQEAQFLQNMQQSVQRACDHVRDCDWFTKLVDAVVAIYEGGSDSCAAAKADEAARTETLSYEQAVYSIDVVHDMELLAARLRSGVGSGQCTYEGYDELAEKIIAHCLRFVESMYGEICKLQLGESTADDWMSVVQMAEETCFRSTMANHVMWHPEQAVANLKKAQIAAVRPDPEAAGDHVTYTVRRRTWRTGGSGLSSAVTNSTLLGSHRKDWAVTGRTGSDTHWSRRRF